MPTRQLHPVSIEPDKRCELTLGSLARAGQVPAPVGVDVNLKSILGYLAIAFVVWWVIEQPSGAAHVVHNIGVFLTSAAHGLSNFFASV